MDTDDHEQRPLPGNGRRPLEGVVVVGASAGGTAAVSKHGGRLIVQDPADAPFPSMPLYAIAADHPDDVLPVEAIAGAITRLVDELRAQPRKEGAMGTEQENLEAAFAGFD